MGGGGRETRAELLLKIHQQCDNKSQQLLLSVFIQCKTFLRSDDDCREMKDDDNNNTTPSELAFLVIFHFHKMLEMGFLYTVAFNLYLLQEKKIRKFSTF